MKNDLALEFSVNRENNTITVKREFAGELSLVWDAYTKPEIIDQWWAPKPWKTKTKTMDFREGGYWQYAMTGPKGELHWARIDYKSVQSDMPSGQRRFVGVDAFADENGNVNEELPVSEWEVVFTGKGNVTLVDSTISYPDLEQLEAVLTMGFREGLLMAMENLDELLASKEK